MIHNKKPSQRVNPVGFGKAHDDPRDGLQTDERNARRGRNERSDSEDNIGDEEEE